MKKTAGLAAAIAIVASPLIAQEYNEQDLRSIDDMRQNIDSACESLDIIEDFFRCAMTLMAEADTLRMEVTQRYSINPICSPGVHALYYMNENATVTPEAVNAFYDIAVGCASEGNIFPDNITNEWQGDLVARYQLIETTAANARLQLGSLTNK